MSAVSDVAAFVSFGLTIGIALTRPKLRNYTLGPAAAAALGVGLAAAFGAVTFDDVKEGVQDLDRALATVGALMITTAAAVQLGVINQLAALAIARAGDSPTRLFALVFGLSALCAAAINNDGAILLLTPIVIVAVRGLYPEQPQLIVAFAFVVFLAAGVAPLVISNPMNMIVADYADIGFNRYAIKMIPISVPGWLLTLAILRFLFRRELAAAALAERTPAAGRMPWNSGQRAMVALLLTVLAAYPVVSYFGGPIWAVALTGAALSMLLCWQQGVARPHEVLRGVPWQILAFLLGIFILALALRNVGVVDWLSDRYDGASLGVIGFSSAIGSALIDNHPMALMNLFAIEQTPGLGDTEILAALIGGDLGPRLLPIGSLAGLLWFESLRRHDVHVSLRRFVAVGATVCFPVLILSLSLLALLT